MSFRPIMEWPADYRPRAKLLRRGAGVLSDADSKPLFISGTGGWRAAATRMGLTEAMLVDGQGKIHITAELTNRLAFTDSNTHPEIEP